MSGLSGKGALALRIWAYISRYKLVLLLAVLFTVASNLFSLVGPMLSGYAIDAIVPGKGAVLFNRVAYYCWLMVAFYVASSLLAYCLSMLMIFLSQQVASRLREDVFKKLHELPVGYFDKNQTGDLISRVTYDIDTLSASLSNDLLQVCNSTITVIGSLAMMLVISPLMTGIFAVTLPVSVVFVMYRSKKVRPLYHKRSVMLGELNGFVEETISGLKTIKAYRKEETFIDHFNEKNTQAIRAYYQADYYGTTIGPTVNFFSNLSLTMISVLGAVIFMAGSISLGNLSSFVLYSRRFSGPISEMANVFNEVQSAFSAAERIFRLLDEEAEVADIPDAAVFRDVAGKVDLDGVHFGYDPDRLIIQDLNLHIGKHDFVAIVGQTGAGKSTIINLLMRFYDPVKGAISLDNVDIKTATRKSLRSSYALVFQDTWLFQGTVFENIAYGNETATLEDVIAAAKISNIHSYISKLPKGYDTVLEEGGINFSQGQRQLLTIARAVLMHSRLLILDEATSNVDTWTELEIQKAMQRLMRDKTCFVIAHRLSTIQNADTILVMQDGQVVEQGSHTSLLHQNGLYHTLYWSQFSA